ncbi:MAG: hypothetical protein KJ727_01105 [Acidobacteria bacterium]|nr:hypothetical protein [Acidobacteriota bacterium]
MGFSPLAINEGLTVVLSELASNDFTGIGISMGGGMCNICFSYLTIPVVTFSLQKAGDYIDQTVGRSVGESAVRIKKIKEETLNLAKDPGNRIDTSLHIHYENLFNTVLKSLQKSLGESTNIPRLTDGVSMVLSGGTVMPEGSLEKFKKIMKDYPLPIKISSVRVAKNPLYTTAKGAWMMAQT